MRTSSSTTRTTPKSMPGGQEAQDAIALLTEDHENVKQMFEQFEGLGDRAHATKKKLATQICTELTKHATAEEEIFYPAVRAATKSNEDLVDEATVEHASAKDLIAQIMEMEATEELFDAKVKVLSEMIEHHVQEEENEMFPKAREAGLDLEALGQQIAERKAQITV
ncbi:Regulator of cell morphogenesis and NO signaling [Janthinobacterium sp. CG23_2]|nr:hemerythrin domain-containing protein [Massilia sp. H27-R4]MCY0912586.1 hemerythrin domain-containing protein [Massilia sp. H27-R4]CUI03642.1 Regulator of cell morphogenesis and NO signaling [Janthinobacterium sp. CG23_2]CUU27428.1 Regulator of cell morphogenesis and NO signaling [Janthinobacterium sp. CG23_2]